MQKKLPREFYERDTHVVAKDLIGKTLVRKWRGQLLLGKIVEVESYVGEDDAACHASKGRTKRTEVMYGEAGYSYVYLIYGMHHCLNVVTEREGFPAAVLIRSVVPLEGVASITDGPGKLTRGFHITKAQNGVDLTESDELCIRDDGVVIDDEEIVAATRIGVEYAGEDAMLPWRYYLNNSDFVSP